MDEVLYEVGEKVAGVYPEGRYIAIKVSGRIHDHYMIVGVLDMPSVRAAANPEAWSGAEVRPYGSMVSFERGGMIKEPKEYEGTAGTEAGDYIDSLREAAGNMREAYIEAGDEAAAFRAMVMAHQAIRNEERRLWTSQNSGTKNVKSAAGQIVSQ